jgi:NAD(P)H-dependent FMN reductase
MPCLYVRLSNSRKGSFSNTLLLILFKQAAMITIISGTNRKDSRTIVLANYYLRRLAELTDTEVTLLDLAKIDIFNFKEEEQAMLIPAKKFVIVMPEYNGTFPGILKLMIDNSDIKKDWYYKKIALTGLADGRAGNLRGLDQLTNVFHYLKADVFYNKLPISSIGSEMDNEGQILKPQTVAAIDKQLTDFLAY